MKQFTFFLFCLVLSVPAWAQSTTDKPASRTAATAVKRPGMLIYEQNCLACHQANGSGVPGLNPPLQKTDWVLGDKNRLINVLLKGLEGQDIEGEPYSNAMPAHDFLTDDQIADVLTYIRSSFGNNAPGIRAEDVKSLRGK